MEAVGNRIAVTPRSRGTSIMVNVRSAVGINFAVAILWLGIQLRTSKRIFSRNATFADIDNIVNIVNVVNIPNVPNIPNIPNIVNIVNVVNIPNVPNIPNIVNIVNPSTNQPASRYTPLRFAE